MISVGIMLVQRQRLWVNIETALGECHVFADVPGAKYTADSVLGQRRRRLTRRLTGIKPAMGCDAGPTLNRYWVGRPTSCVRGISSSSYGSVH